MTKCIISLNVYTVGANWAAKGVQLGGAVLVSGPKTFLSPLLKKSVEGKGLSDR